MCTCMYIKTCIHIYENIFIFVYSYLCKCVFVCSDMKTQIYICITFFAMFAHTFSIIYNFHLLQF